MGRGLAASGMSPAKNILIFAETRADWIIAALACFRQNYTGKLPVVGFKRALNLFRPLLAPIGAAYTYGPPNILLNCSVEAV